MAPHNPDTGFVMTTAKELRRSFVDYFKENDHQSVASYPLVPRNDPSLLFTSAGMVQFKNIFTGLEAPPAPRAVTVQKCLRAGGKHNDLENVGYTARHHTFFEMMGNFSFGDYFKERAIPLAWELLTKHWGLPPERLWITVFHEDDEARRIWRKVSGFPDSRILGIAGDDNFWSMGATGPCGPCSEIFFDHGEAIAGGLPGTPEQDGDRFVEIWNLVFMQYEQTEAGRLDLPHPSIDTGMGLERIAALVQGSHDNFASDLFQPLLQAVAEATGVEPDGALGASHRVIADHVRAAAFLIADDVLPAREGRGYVLRRILRRAMRHARQLGARDPLLWKLVPILTAGMGEEYPELVRAGALISETLHLEERRFGETLERGLGLLEEAVERLPDGAPLDGAVAFRLYDTYGFPLDLTEDILRAKGISVARAEFETAMAEQRTRARKSWVGAGGEAAEAMWFGLAERPGATEFLGYTTLRAAGAVGAIVVDGGEVERVGAGGVCEVVCNQTPFYAESGGQEGDRGTAFGDDGLELEITDVVRRGDGLHVHRARVLGGELVRGAVLDLQVDGARRLRLRAHHSATHLLHEALRRVLGPHVVQKGSLVAADRLRFDFSHPRPLEAAELRAVEDSVNQNVQAGGQVQTRLMTPEEATQTAGALALFGERYGEQVRVVSMGGDDGERPLGLFSTELCGGTHVAHTAEVGTFRITASEGLASGVRRVVAVSGGAALDHLRGREEILAQLSLTLRTPPNALQARVVAVLEETKELNAQITNLRRKLALGSSDGAPQFHKVAGIRLAKRHLEDVPAAELRTMVDALKRELGSGVVLLASVADGRASLVVGITEDLVPKLNAVELVRLGAERVGGKGGGGRPDFARAGGPEGGDAEAALGVMEEALRGVLEAASALL